MAELCARAGTSDREGVYNAGSGEGLSVNEVADAIRKVTGSDFEMTDKQGRAVDVPHSVLDCSRAKTTSVGSMKSSSTTSQGRCFGWRQDHLGISLVMLVPPPRLERGTSRSTILWS